MVNVADMLADAEALGLETQEILLSGLAYLDREVRTAECVGCSVSIKGANNESTLWVNGSGSIIVQSNLTIENLQILFDGISVSESFLTTTAQATALEIKVCIPR